MTLAVGCQTESAFSLGHRLRAKSFRSSREFQLRRSPNPRSTHPRAISVPPQEFLRGLWRKTGLGQNVQAPAPGPPLSTPPRRLSLIVTGRSKTRVSSDSRSRA